MTTFRPAAVAGSFYPESAGALGSAVEACLSSASASAGPVPKAIIAPHAGYVYSGPIAAQAYARLRPLAGRVSRVVLMGPAHAVHVRGAAVPAVDAFQTPLGAVPIDRRALERLEQLPFVTVDDRAHRLEHSLEVHLPFLQTVLGVFSLVPVVVGDATAEETARLFEVLWGGPETLVVVSSDLSHYHAYDVARSIDRATAEGILRLEGPIDPEQACGAAPINGLLAFARRRGLRAELIDLRNSGDTAGGRDRVVGYGAFAFHEAADA